MARNTDANKPTVLIVDDQFFAFRSLPKFISSETFFSVWVPDEQHGLDLLKERPDANWIIIVDLKSSGMGGGGFLHQARQVAPRAAVLVTGPLGPFLYKGGSFYELSGPSLRREINTILKEVARDMNGNGETGEVPKHRPDARERQEQFGNIIGRSESINSIFQWIQNLKNSSATVLVQGESGTGKELIARTIHQTSLRKDQSFVAINCGAIPGSLMESELFGHERGAFTGAVFQKKGKFEAAHGGTLFLDEIGELDKDLQVKLLRVLQEKEFQRVGGNATIKTDVRIIAATSQDLRSNVQKGEFREDLFYRLNVLPIHVPPLRERREDIPLLLEHFFRKTCGTLQRTLPSLTPEAWDALLRYSYPGNVRELANLVERLLVTCPQRSVTFHDMPEEVLEECGRTSEPAERLRELPEEGVTLHDVERELIVKTLQKTSGNKRAAARMLGITRRLLYLRLAQYGIN